MKLISWNLNHRASRHAIPTWIAAAIDQQNPDVIVLTEYVEGPDHATFLGMLSDQGLVDASLSSRPKRQNQILIVTREPHTLEPLEIPDIHPSVSSNALLVTLASGVRVLGFRMPAYEKQDRRLKRPTWEWLLREVAQLRSSPTIIAGDFNTAPGDSAHYCGDCLVALVEAGWTHARPSSGVSWQGRSAGRCIDHAFLSASLRNTSAHYSWDFEQLDPTIRARNAPPGIPDHAMLIVEALAVSATGQAV